MAIFVSGPTAAIIPFCLLVIFPDTITAPGAAKRKPKTEEPSNVLIANVCNLVENCNIEEISKFLINEGKNKKFPNINIKE